MAHADATPGTALAIDQHGYHISHETCEANSVFARAGRYASLSEKMHWNAPVCNPVLVDDSGEGELGARGGSGRDH